MLRIHRSSKSKHARTSSKQPTRLVTEEDKLLNMFRIIGLSMEHDLLEKRNRFATGRTTFQKQVQEEETGMAAELAAELAANEDLASAFDDELDVQPTSDPFAEDADDDGDGEDDDEVEVDNHLIPNSSSSEKKTKTEKQKK